MLIKAKSGSPSSWRIVWWWGKFWVLYRTPFNIQLKLMSLTFKLGKFGYFAKYFVWVRCTPLFLMLQSLSVMVRRNQTIVVLLNLIITFQHFSNAVCDLNQTSIGFFSGCCFVILPENTQHKYHTTDKSTGQSDATHTQAQRNRKTMEG